MDRWVVVVDGDETSKRQMDVCRVLRPPLQGAIDCSDPDNASATVCTEVDFFPAFCDTEQRKCVYGLRETIDELEGLVRLSTTSSSQDTTPSQPPPSNTSQ